MLRLIAAGWTLIRADALLPIEADAYLPAGLRFTARALRLLSARKGGRPGQRLASALEGLGPAAIKLGQLLSTRADIFGETFANDLGRLKDRLEAFSLDQARAEIERSLGRAPDDLFIELHPAIAAASIAQAHPALLADGRKVAVKVLRPGVEARIARDSEVLRLAARLVNRWAPPARRLEPQALVETVIRSLELELDLRLEAGGADELRSVMALDGFMTAPAVVWEGVGKRVMTLEWAQGAPLSEPQALEQTGLDRAQTAAKLVQGFLAQALEHGVFHADLHEGNLFVQPPARLTVVDFGIIGRIGPVERLYLAEILWGFITRDYERVARAHFDAGYVPKSYSPALFAQAVRAIGEPVSGKLASTVSMGRLLTQLFDVTAQFDMRLRPELVLLQKTMVTVEGVGRRLDPDLNIWTAAEPVVRRYITRELSPLATTRRHLGDVLTALKAIAVIAQNQADAALVPTRAPSSPTRRALMRQGLWLGAGLVLGGGAVWLLANLALFALRLVLSAAATGY